MTGVAGANPYVDCLPTTNPSIYSKNGCLNKVDLAYKHGALVVKFRLHDSHEGHTNSYLSIGFFLLGIAKIYSIPNLIKDRSFTSTS